jgi:outer membrane protein OmpA-like peptidoglycan-associated protein
VNSFHPHRLVGLASVVTALFAPGAAQAQTLSRFALRAELGAGLMTPTVQRQTLGYDGVHVQANGRIGFDAVDWLSLQISVSNGFFWANNQRPMGRTLAFQGGVRLQPPVGTVGRLWADINPGYFLTGDDRRFGFDAGLGFEFDLGRAVALGPFARAHWVKANPDVHVPSDAFYLSFGLSLSLRVPPDPTVEAPGDRDGDGVLDADDLCVDVPQGANPDPSRRGCPRSDRDGDGVFDEEDQCVTTPQGPNPDPTRRGCPRVDTDGDGVFDNEDQCVTTPQGANPDPTRRGCPAGDRDGDGVVDHEDRCPDESRLPFPDPSRNGCPLPDADHDQVPEPPDACPGVPGVPSPDPARNGCPSTDVRMEGGQIRILQQVFFDTDRDTIKRRSNRILQAVADVLRAAPHIRRVSVDGHTDNRADEAHNMDLSQRRAAAVVRWLVEHGIEPSRLEAHGYGPTRPIDTNDTAAGRARNRRVEFVILDPPQPTDVRSVASAPEGPPVDRRSRHRRRRQR